MKKFTLMLLALAMISSSALAFDNVTPNEAYLLATTDANTYILDVRTIAEWDWVGHPGVNNLGDGDALIDKVVNISYKIEYKKDFIVNPSFIADVQEQFDPAAVTLITMCRSGKRSADAAAELEALGYTMLNMLTGFEGDKTTEGYRAVNGWKVDGLPYTYNGEGYTD